MSIPQSTLLAGRTALVTGAASGIGRAIAAHFLAAGARVVLADRAESVIGAAADIGAAGALVVDATDEQQVADTVAEAAAVLGRIDVLVTSHGILTQSPLVQMPLAQWRETLDVDLASVFLLNRAVLPGMLAAGDGRIINVASQLGIKGGASLAHYAAAKAGVIAMSKSLALEVSARGRAGQRDRPGAHRDTAAGRDRGGLEGRETRRTPAGHGSAPPTRSPQPPSCWHPIPAETCSSGRSSGPTPVT